MPPQKRENQLFNRSQSQLAVPLNLHHPREGATLLRHSVPQPVCKTNKELARSPLKLLDRPLHPRLSSLNPHLRKHLQPYLSPQTMLLRTNPSRIPKASSLFFRAINKSASRTRSAVRAILYQSVLQCQMRPLKTSRKHQHPHKRRHPPVHNPWRTGSTKLQARAIQRQPKKQQICNKLSS